jgi:hypothetical protein
MKRKTKVFVALLSFGTYLGISTTPQAESNQADGSVSARLVVVPAARPEQGSLIPVSVMPLVIAGKTLGKVVSYDDPTTGRPADGFELYDGTGGLVAAGWFDRFGIRRITVDRALIEGGDELEGIFVSVLEGDTI